MTLETPVDAIVFDCDGTLSKLEGINELARMNGVEEEVAKLTENAMSQGVFNAQVYQQRLDLTRPTFSQLEILGKRYYECCTDDVEQVIQCLRTFNKSIFIVTAGLTPAIAIFAEALHIPQSNIYAVDVHFDQQGNYMDFDHHSPLVTLEGKYQVVKQIMQTHPRVVHVGDGLNDCATMDIVTRFVGFGGNYYRASMKQRCDYYINEPTIMPLLSLCLTASELKQL